MKLRGMKEIFGDFQKIRNGLKAGPHKAQAFTPGEGLRKMKAA